MRISFAIKTLAWIAPCIIFVFTQSLASAISTSNNPLIADPNYHFFVDIYGTYITYTDRVNGQGPDMPYLYNFRNGKTTSLPADATTPKIYKDNIAYISSKTGYPEVYLYNVKNGKSQQLTFDANDKFSADIWGDIIVWAESPLNSVNNIYMYNIQTQTITQITHGTTIDEHSPSAGNNWISWTDGSGPSQTISVYNLANGQIHVAVTKPWADHSRTYNDTLVWDDRRRGTDFSDVYAMNLINGDEQLISDGTGFDGRPWISKSKVVYVNFSSNEGDIEEYNLKTNQRTQITNDPATQSSPVIQGDKIVWIDYRNGPPEIYGNIWYAP